MFTFLYELFFTSSWLKIVILFFKLFNNLLSLSVETIDEPVGHYVCSQFFSVGTVPHLMKKDVTHYSAKYHHEYFSTSCNEKKLNIFWMKKTKKNRDIIECASSKKGTEPKTNFWEITKNWSSWQWEILDSKLVSWKLYYVVAFGYTRI